MKLDKHFLEATGIVLATGCLIALTWIGATRTIHSQRQESAAGIDTRLAAQARTFSEQINRQILDLDQTLQFCATVWQTNPGGFDLAAWRSRAVTLSGLSQDIILIDETGIIRQSSVAGTIAQSLAGEADFQALSKQTNDADRLFIGPPEIGMVLRQWHMNVARTLHHADGSFAGIIKLDYRTSAITDLFTQAGPDANAFDAVVGLDDGKVRAAIGPTPINPGAAIASTQMFAALHTGNRGIWVGPSPIDGVTRVHAFELLPQRAMAVVVSTTQAEAMRAVNAWGQQETLFAGCLTVLLTGMGLLLLQNSTLAHRRTAALAKGGAELAAASAQLNAARGAMASKAELLEAALGGMTDGVSMFDAQDCLMQWNDRFPEVTGVPADMLRVGLPMEDIVRTLVISGEFGGIDDPEADIANRMARLHSGRYNSFQRQRPDGRTIELRRKNLPEGGFVTVYADVTEHKRVEAALREAQWAAERATAAKSRFVAIVSHEIRTPLHALLNSLQLLADSVLTPVQRSQVGTASQSGDALSGLINDILEMSQIEANKLVIRPTIFELRPLLTSAVEMLGGQAAEQGIAIRILIGAAVPTAVRTDAGRLRQVLLNLLSNAVKYAAGGEIRLEADPGRTRAEAVRLVVKDRGPVIDAAARSHLFQPFSQLERPADKATSSSGPGTGLGLSICRELVTLMGGEIGCEPWIAADGHQGNAFWLTLPASARPDRLPAGTELSAAAWLGRPPQGPGAPVQTSSGEARPSGGPFDQALMGMSPADPRSANLPGHRPPRSRILLVEDIAANQIVTATLLRREGHMVDVVPSGQAAIEAVQRACYDLVFMDIFMPGMGGEEATVAIRTQPAPAGTVPIVALTANVTTEAERAFRAAGMDGVLGKPVSLTELLASLQTQVWSSRGTARRPFPAEVPALAAAEHAVLATDRLQELRANLPTQTFVALVEACLVDLDQRVSDLRLAFAAGSLNDIVVHSHAMVGMAGGYGMASLETLLRSVTRAASAGDLGILVPDCLARVEAELAATTRAMREMLQDVLA